MAEIFARGKHALGLCDRCGFRYKLNTLKPLIIRGIDTRILVCKSCWDGDHPQLWLGSFPVNDPQALRDPRPDILNYAESRALYEPIRIGLGAPIKLGQVEVVIT